ncbi:MAG: DUF2721 domain-containing protein [Thermoanaerobaculia bacterium]
MSHQDLIPILQVAVGPVILISGVGLLLLSMTNRFGRIIDRTRQLTNERRLAVPENHESLVAQLRILLRRARIVRAAIAFAAVSLLLAALLIIVLFTSAILQLGLVLSITGLFVACLVSLIASLVLFIGDINVSLTALKLEVGSLE